MKKGDLVMLNEAVCFTKTGGGLRRYPMGSFGEDDKRIVRASRPTTPEEQRDWYESPDSKGMDSAGESKLPPQAVGITIHADRKYVVERARCRIRLGWGNPTPGMAKILCTNTGEIAYIKREYLRVI
jgi:hypothetical protein